MKKQVTDYKRTCDNCHKDFNEVYVCTPEDTPLLEFPDHKRSFGTIKQGRLFFCSKECLQRGILNSMKKFSTLSPAKSIFVPLTLPTNSSVAVKLKKVQEEAVESLFEKIPESIPLEVTHYTSGTKWDQSILVSDITLVGHKEKFTHRVLTFIYYGLPAEEFMVDSIAYALEKYPSVSKVIESFFQGTFK
jgi:hypothetical protein